VRIDAVNWVVSGLQPLRSVKDEHLLLVSKNHAAMDELAKGRGTRDHLDVLIAALNMTEAIYRVRADLGKDWAGEIRAGQDALLTMTRRGVERGNRLLFTGPEMKAVNLALEIHDAQLDMCIVAELEAAIGLVQAEIKAKRARVIERTEVSLCGS
jgi:uncharacterized small protein (DUF1192 family)